MNYCKCKEIIFVLIVGSFLWNVGPISGQETDEFRISSFGGGLLNSAIYLAVQLKKISLG